MCDYSLHGIANRLAEVGEVLVVHRFHTGSKGLTSPEYLKPTEQPQGLMTIVKGMFAAQPRACEVHVPVLKRKFAGASRECAVCIPDGAKLMLRGISPALQEAHGLFTAEAVTFRQLSADALTYRDAVEFKNGVKVRLQSLEDGQSVEVLSLSSEKAGVRNEAHSAKVGTRDRPRRTSAVA